MGTTRIVWTPPGASQVVADFGIRRGATRFAGGWTGDVDQSFTPGNRVVTVINSLWREYDFRVDQVDRDADRLLWNRLQAWTLFAMRGGEWALQLDSDQTFDSTITGAIVGGTDTTFAVAAVAGLAEGDPLLFVDLLDPTIAEWKTVRTIDSGTVASVYDGFDNDFVSGSIVRHAELFPKCALIQQRRLPFLERDAKRGPGWELRFKFRTVES